MLRHQYRAAILTVSDTGSEGRRTDESGPAVKRLTEEFGVQVSRMHLLPDDEEQITSQLIQWADCGEIDLILTTGGTGFSLRDRTPEATLAAADRLAPGMAEAMRARSIEITPYGMLSRAVCAIRGMTLIINLPGSPKAAVESLEAVLPALEHALDILCANVSG